ncbi:hypothetical protein BDR03DRAFT_1018065 [Suillus americanus]|nr:hypothetical protein BDR03DRAFT_1018065 [Suillus americanus]
MILNLSIPLDYSNLPRRPDGNRIHAFWSEVSQLQSQVIQPSKVDDLTAALETGDPSAFARESVMQESISGFCQRMDNPYHDFRDIAKIIHLVLPLLRLGIRLVRCYARQMSYAQHTQQNLVASSLVTYPSLRSAQLLQTQLEPGAAPRASPSDQVLLHVSAIGLCAAMSGLVPHAAAVQAAYERSFRLWTMDRTHQNEKDMMTRRYSDSTSHFPRPLSQTTLPDTFDDESLHEQLSFVHDHLLALKSQERTASQLFNFYANTNIREVKKALATVDSLTPDRPLRCVLGPGHKQSHCQIVEIMLQTDDWEMYAYRGNSIRAHEQELTMIVVEWRRLKLSGWKAPLQSQSDSFVKGVLEFWFRLYDLTVRGALSAAYEDEGAATGALQQYLRQLSSLLDDFMRSSAPGQFQVRLDLLQTFSVMLTGSLVDQRGGLEKDVQAFIKLASWKDVNV